MSDDVVEKSAYDQVLKERDEMVKLARQAQDACLELANAKMLLLAEVERLRNLLDER